MNSSLSGEVAVRRWFGAILFLVLAICGCLGAAPAQKPTLPPAPAKPLKVGVLAPLHTGPGDGIVNAARMAVEDINGAGSGLMIELVVIDSEFDSAKTLAGYERLAGYEGCVAVVGVASSGIFPIMAKLKQYRVPMVTTGCGADRLTEMVQESYGEYQWFFRVMHRSSELAYAVADFAIEYLHKEKGLNRFAIMVENEVWTKQLAEIWADRLGKTPGVSVVFNEKFSSDTTDFTPLITKVIRSKAQYVLDACSQIPATAYLKPWAEFQGPPIGAVPTGAGTKAYFDELGRRGIGVSSVGTIPSQYNPLTERSAEWGRRYLKKFEGLDYTSGYTYDAMWILKEALERSRGEGGEALVKALEKTDHAGVAARWAFDGSHHSRLGKGYRTMPIIQYQEPDVFGFKVIWPRERAKASFIFPVWDPRGLRASPTPGSPR